jgi:ring-1,2-phenylacetyl-CoA epoxidase subunit PaaD
MLTIEDLGVLRSVESAAGQLVVTLTPTYLACPALDTMKADLRVALARAGFDDVEVRTRLTPAWSTDWISERGRAALAAHGIVPPEPVRSQQQPVLVQLQPAPAPCPQCGSPATAPVSGYGATACLALHRCHACGEPFDRMKPI